MSPTSTAQTVAPPMNSAPINGPLTAGTFRDIAKTVSPAVVNIRTESRQRAQDLSEFFGGGGGGGGDLFERFFGQPNPNQRTPQQPQQPREQLVQAAGTGFIIDKAGYILTNNHVVEGATKIVVSLYGEDSDQEYAARVVGRDPLTDSALIELTEKPNHTLPEVKFGDSGADSARGLRHGDRQPVRPGAHRQRRHHQRRRAAVPGVRGSVDAGAADRRGHQSGQLGRSAAEPSRRGGRHQHGDHQRPAAVRATSASASRSRSTSCVSSCRSCAPARSPADGSASVSAPMPTDAVDEFGLKDRNGAVVLNLAPGGAAATRGSGAGRRDRRHTTASRSGTAMSSWRW